MTTLLLVEDDSGLRATLNLVLRRAGYDVVQAASGEAALALLHMAEEDGTPPYDLVLTDIVMGTVDGVAVLHAARRLHPPPEVVLLTGYASVDTAVEALRAGAYDYLQKPCSNAALLACLQRALAHHRSLQQHQQAIRTLSQLAATLEDHMDDEIAPLESSANPDPSPDTVPDPDTGSSKHYISVGTLTIDMFRHEVRYQGNIIHLTPSEFALVAFLAQTPGRVVSPDDIVLHTHEHEATPQEARLLLKPHVLNLRRKLPPDCLVNVRGTGYMLVPPKTTP